MELKEKWICPDAEVQRFTPQEYVATCYQITVTCRSLGYISYDGTANNIKQHSGGDNSTSFILNSNSSPTDDQVIVAMQTRYSLSLNAKSANEGNWGHFKNGKDGYAWKVENVWHFTLHNTGWYTSNPSPENAS